MNENEKFVIELIKKGVFSIDEEGKIWRHQIRLSRLNDYKPLAQPRRAEQKSSGYYALDISDLSRSGKKYRTKAHRIVWIHFYGDIDNNLTINHKNGIKTDNRPSNLELLTASDNLKHACKIGLITGAEKGEKHPLAKMTVNDIKEIRRLYNTTNMTQTVLANKYNLSQGQIGRIVRGERWKHIEQENKQPTLTVWAGDRSRLVYHLLYSVNEAKCLCGYKYQENLYAQIQKFNGILNDSICQKCKAKL